MKAADFPVVVIGAGIMGTGIAQVAAQAGHPVQLFDTRAGAAADACARLATTFDGLVAKGKLSAEQAADVLGRISVASTLAEVATASLVVEAIIEQLDAKHALFAQLEAVMMPTCILASNTSSLSVTALASGLRQPERFVGMHFFNPVPLMKLVEVISGLRTDPAIAQQVVELAEAWGKVAVRARSTPGFIVNRIARPFYAETFALLHERAAEPAVLDACLRAAGFRMGACELTDLIGQDTNFAVTASMFDANFGDKRYVPSLVQRELVDSGLFGRKVNGGFYQYHDGKPAPPSLTTSLSGELTPTDRLVLHGDGAVVAAWAAAFAAAGRAFDRQLQSDWIGLEVDRAQLRLTDGRAAGEVGAGERRADLAVFDLTLGEQIDGVLAWSAAEGASSAWQQQAPLWLALAGCQPQRLADTPGLIVARTIAMLINEAADAVLQGVCSVADADAAMKLGVNYPAGPFEWLAAWGVQPVVTLLDNLANQYRSERYRVSLWLRRRAWTEAAARSTS